MATSRGVAGGGQCGVVSPGMWRVTGRGVSATCLGGYCGHVIRLPLALLSRTVLCVLCFRIVPCVLCCSVLSRVYCSYALYFPHCPCALHCLVVFVSAIVHCIRIMWVYCHLLLYIVCGYCPVCICVVIVHCIFVLVLFIVYFPGVFILCIALSRSEIWLDLLWSPG